MTPDLAKPTLFWSVILTILAVPAEGSKLNRYTSNSADFGRSMNRSATTDLDAAYYNPAGLVFGRQGLGLELSNQSTYLVSRFKNQQHDKSDGGFAWASPSASVVYTGLDFSLGFFIAPMGGGVTQVAGEHPVFDANGQFVVDSANERLFGGVSTIEDVRLQNSFLEARNLYLGGLFTGAYRITSWLSLALGLKYIQYSGDLTLRSDYSIQLAGRFITAQPFSLQAEQVGHGFGGIASVHIRPSSTTNFGLRYETRTAIDARTDVEEQTLEVLSDGGRGRSDIPAMLAGGFDQSLTQRLSLQGSFGYVFNDDAEFGEFLGFDISEQIDAGWEIGLGIEYALDDQLLLSAGYLYIESGYNAQTLTVNRFTLDAHFVGGGGRYQVTDNLDITFGLYGMLWIPARAEMQETQLDQDALVGALDMGYWF